MMAMSTSLACHHVSTAASASTIRNARSVGTVVARPAVALAASASTSRGGFSHSDSESRCSRVPKYGCFGQFSSLAGTSLVRRVEGRRWVAPASASRRRGLRVVAEDKPDVLKAAGFIIKIGKDGLDAGTNLVPEAVPRGVARIGVGVVGAVVVSYVLRSLFSTALFILAIAGFSYLAYLYVSKDSDSGSGGGGGGGSGKSRNLDDSLEEARRIMEKYK